MYNKKHKLFTNAGKVFKVSPVQCTESIAKKSLSARHLLLQTTHQITAVL